MAQLKNTSILGTLSATGVSTLFTTNVGSNSVGANISAFGTLGAEMAPGFAASAWTLTAGWDATNLSDTALNKDANGLTTATPSGSGATPVASTTYKIVITVGAVSVASGFTWTYGGVTMPAITAAGTYTYYVTATTTGKIIFTPTPTATRFTITGLSIKSVTTSTGDLVSDGDLKLGGTLKKPDGTLIARISPVGVITTAQAFSVTGAITGSSTLAIAGAFSGATTGAFSGAVTITGTSIAYVNSPRAILTNTTAATAVAPIQLSPGLEFRSHVWDSADRTSNWFVDSTPIYDASTATARLAFKHQHNSTTSISYQDRMSLGSEGTLDIFGSTFASETLTNGALTSGTSWTRTGDMALTGNAATYTHSSGVGTLSQASGTLAIAGKANRWYKFTYTTSTVVTGCTAYIDTTFAAKRIYLGLVAGTYTIYFKAAASPGNFTINVTSTAGNFTIDTLSLTEVTSGNIIANGKFTGGGTVGLTIDGNGAASFGGTLDIGGVTVPTISSTSTLTNKRITKRVVTTTDDATAVIDTDITDDYELTAVANATTFTVTGTPTDGQMLFIRFKDAGVAKALTWTMSGGVIGVTLPTTTVAGKWHIVGFKYFTSTTSWKAIAVGVEA